MQERDDHDAQVLQNHLETARFFLTGGQWQRCTDALRRALALDPNLAEGHAMLAICAARLGDPAQARREANEALALDSSDDYCFYASVIAARAEGDLTRAFADVRGAMDINPERAYLHFEMYALYKIQKRWEQAQPYIRYALYLAPEKALYHLEMALTHFALHQNEEGDRELAETLRLDPENAQAQKFLGLRQLDRLEREAAVSTLRSSLSLNPNDTQVQRELLFAEKPLLRWAEDINDAEKVDSNWQTFGFLALLCAVGAIGSGTVHTPMAFTARWPYLIFSLLTALTLFVYSTEEMLMKHSPIKVSMWSRRFGMLLITSFLLFFHWLYWVL